MGKEIKNYVLVSHVFHSNSLPIYGPIHALQDYLASKKIKTSWLYLPLELQGQISRNIEDRDQVEVKREVKYQNLFGKILSDLWQTFLFIFQVELTSKTRVVAADPLSCLPFGLVKPFFGFDLIYYTVDYSDRRFSVGVLNQLYNLIDRFCLVMCDQNWCVSTRIFQKRIDSGFKPSKIKFVPNTPVLADPPKIQSPTKKHTLVYVGRMDQSMSVMTLVKVVADMSKSFPKLKLVMIGGGQDEAKITDYINKSKLEKVIIFLGPKPNAEVIAELKKSGIGLALYNGGNSWNEYGDSMKIREYNHFGLPAVTTQVPANCLEVEAERSGVVLSASQIDSRNIRLALEQIFKDYKNFSTAANKLALKYQKQKIFDSLLT